MYLHGKKVTLRTIESTDLPIIYGEKNPEWKKFDAPYFLLKHISYEEFASKYEQKAGSSGIATEMVIQHEGKIIGRLNYYWEYELTRWLEVGIAIYSPNHWSGGFGHDALTLWIDYLFQHLEIERVGLTTWSGNPRMMRCAEKLGMKLEGRMRKCRYYDGTYYDSIRMGILREEWKASPIIENARLL